MPPPWQIQIGVDPEIKQELKKITKELQRIGQQLGVVAEKQEETMADLAALQAEVQQNSDVTQSAVTLIQGLSQQLKDAIAANDPAAIQAVVDQLDANTQSLADAVANVPHPEQR
jgi:chromosome segregation ATPase